MKELPMLYEILIYDKGDRGGYKIVDDEKWWNLIKEISEDILCDDNHWHYFYERYYLIVRCQKKFIKRVRKLLDSKDIQYSYEGIWIDGSDVVEYYKNVFQPLFHNFTKLAIQGYSKSFRMDIVDRVIHCFMNHQFYNFKDYRETNGYYTWEAQIISSNAISRAVHQGRVWQDDHIQIEKDKKKKKKGETSDGDGKSSSGGGDGG